jgi:hypothetical protein
MPFVFSSTLVLLKQKLYVLDISGFLFFTDQICLLFCTVCNYLNVTLHKICVLSFESVLLVITII